MRGPRVLVLLSLGALLAGCVAQPAPGPLAQTAATPASGASGPAPAFDLEGKGCLMGGGHSVHSTSIAAQIVPEPWKVADILGDVGPQLIYPEEPWDGVPTEGKTWGNWHVTVRCDGWTYDGKALKDLVFGFVVTKVEQPPFDAGPAGPRYILNVLATSDDAMEMDLHALGFHATLTTGVAEWTLPGVFHNKLDTKDHGVYEALFHTKAMGAMPNNLTRLWWQREAGNGTFQPIALDLHATGGQHSIADPNGYFSHLRTTDHEPLPGAAGNIAGLVYQGFDFTLTLGPRANVTLDKAYEHL